MAVMERLTERIWYTPPSADTDRPVLAAVAGTERTLMVDGGNSPRHASTFVDELHREGLQTPDFIALTHAHCDHLFGLAVLPGLVLATALTAGRISALNALGWCDPDVEARVAAGREHEMTAYMLREEMPGDRTGFQVRRPDLVYNSALRLHLGGLECRLEHVGGGHAPDSAVVFIERERVLFMGDCLYLPEDDHGGAERIYARLLAFDADHYVDSHRDVPLTRKDLEARHRAAR
jgi:glyoxylase-like metal-dependent hydrolase (beta-lactamase superfamily II)